ncbi:MAG TPA: hypothetical protein VG652_08230 [Gaiellaceae bacterium]|nr:hypothetical protein [Gaiellaceae bacterium]
MSRIAAFGRFWWDFVVGDDWLVAAEIVAAIAITAAVAHSSVSAWWVLPVVVALVLYSSLRRAIRAQQ